jgi:hypothetical protein
MPPTPATLVAALLLAAPVLRAQRGLATVRLGRAAGVRVPAGTDASDEPYVFAGSGLHDELGGRGSGKRSHGQVCECASTMFGAGGLTPVGRTCSARRRRE